MCVCVCVSAFLAIPHVNYMQNCVGMSRCRFTDDVHMDCFGELTRKCFNHVHVQKGGFTKFSVFLKRVSLLNLRVRTNFVAFPLERTTGKSLVKFGSILGCDRGLVNNCSAAVGRAPNWTGRALNSSY